MSTFTEQLLDPENPSSIRQCEEIIKKKKKKSEKKSGNFKC